MSLSVIVHAVLSRDVLPAFRLWQVEAIAQIRREPGCLRYDMYVDIDDARHFIFLQEWVSADAYQRHFTQPHIADSMGRWSAHWVSPPVIIATLS